MDKGLKLAIKAVGTRYRLAKLLEISTSAVQRWDHIPSGRIIEVEKATGVPRESLRPDLYRQPDLRRGSAVR